MEQQGYFVEFTGEYFQSVFPEHESDVSQLHDTAQNAVNYIVQQTGVYPTIL